MEEGNSTVSRAAGHFLRLGAQESAEKRIGCGGLAAHGFRNPTASDQGGGGLEESLVALAGPSAEPLVAEIVRPTGGIQRIGGSGLVHVARTTLGKLQVQMRSLMI